MFTLKLWRHGSPTLQGRNVIMECAGFWIDHCDHGVLHVHAFKKNVGVQDEDCPFDCYVSGDIHARTKEPGYDPKRDAIVLGAGGNHYHWGVIENANGKTTEMLR